MKGGKNKMNNKKGISAIVATVLIILITVAAVTIIWAAIIPMVSDNLDKGKACLDVSTGGLEVLNKGFTCDDGNDGATVQIKQGSADIDLSKIQIILSDGSNAVTVYVTDVPGINGIKTYTIAEGNFTSFNGRPVTEVSVAAVVDVDGGDVTCDISSTAKSIPTCAP